MSTLTRTLGSLVLVGLLAACSGGSPAGGGASPGATDAPQASPSADPDAIDHATGATDVVLRYEEGGGFVMPAFAATTAPIFTLYGDGTVIYRDPMDEAPPAEGPIMRQNPFRTAKLSEEQVQDLLLFALREGGLATAKPNYENPLVADAGTTVFTVKAGGVEKTVSIYALGMEGQDVPDLPARAQFTALAERLRNLDQDGAFPTDPWTPTQYRAILMDDGGFPGPEPVAWPFEDLTPDDFVADPNNPNMGFPARVMSAEEVAALGLEGVEGGMMGMTLVGPDNTTYSFSLRPLLPDEEA